RHYRTQKRNASERPIAPAALSPSGEAMLKEELSRRRCAMEALEPVERETIRWHDDEGLTLEEIDCRRGYSASYASRVYRHARARLLAIYQERSGTDPAYHL